MDTTSENVNFVQHQPLVSILLLTYNRARYLKDAIASVIKQTHTNWELIIIDDGSTDSTKEVVQSFGESRIRYVRHAENAGLHARRKESLGYVKGEFVAVLDSDDYWVDEDKLAFQVAHLEEQTECVLIGTFAILVDETGTQIGQRDFATGDHSIRERILQKNQFIHSSVLMRTATLKKTRGYQPLLAEDLELFLQLGKLGTFANLPGYMTAHRVHAESENDHGIKMCSAVHRIIKRHQDYPHYTKAWLRSHARLLVSRVRLLAKPKR